MNSPIRLVKSKPAIEDGFLAAGIATASIAVGESVFIVLSWLVSVVV